MNVIDQHDMPPAQPLTAIGRDGEDAGDGTSTRLGAHPAQRRGRLGATQDERIVRHPGDAAQRLGDQRRLVEAARPQPPAVQRHRHEQLGIVRQQPRHLPGDRLGKGDATAIFEP